MMQINGFNDANDANDAKVCSDLEYIYLENIGKALMFWVPAVKNKYENDVVVRTIRISIANLLFNAGMYVVGGGKIAAWSIGSSYCLLDFLEVLSANDFVPVACLSFVMYLAGLAIHVLRDKSQIINYHRSFDDFTLPKLLLATSIALIGKAFIKICKNWVLKQGSDKIFDNIFYGESREFPLERIIGCVKNERMRANVNAKFFWSSLCQSFNNRRFNIEQMQPIWDLAIKTHQLNKSVLVIENNDSVNNTFENTVNEYVSDNLLKSLIHENCPMNFTILKQLIESKIIDIDQFKFVIKQQQNLFIGLNDNDWQQFAESFSDAMKKLIFYSALGSENIPFTLY